MTRQSIRTSRRGLEMQLRDEEVGTVQTWKGSPHREARKQIKTRPSLPTLIRVTKIKCDEPRDYQGCEKTTPVQRWREPQAGITSLQNHWQ